MSGFFTALRRWASTPQSSVTTFRPLSPDHHPADYDDHIGELDHRPIDLTPDFRTRIIASPPARGQQETLQWLAAGGSTESIEKLSRVRDDAAKFSRRRTILGRSRGVTDWASQTVDELYLGHHVPPSIADCSRLWIIQTMFDLYHPLGDRNSYFVRFSGVTCPYPSRVGCAEASMPDQPQLQDLVSDDLQPWSEGASQSKRTATGPLSELAMNDIELERERSRKKGLRVSPYPPPWCSRKQGRELDAFSRRVSSVTDSQRSQGVGAVRDGNMLRQQRERNLSDRHDAAQSGDLSADFQKPDFSGCHTWPSASASAASSKGQSSDHTHSDEDDLIDVDRKGHVEMQDSLLGEDLSADGEWDIFESLQDTEPERNVHHASRRLIFGWHGTEWGAFETRQADALGGSSESLHLPLPSRFEEYIVCDDTYDEGTEAGQVDDETDGGRVDPDNVRYKLRSFSDSDDELDEAPPFEPDSSSGREALRRICQGLSLDSDTTVLEIQGFLIRNQLFREICLHKVPGGELYDPNKQFIFERGCANKEYAWEFRNAIYCILWPEEHLNHLVRVGTRREGYHFRSLSNYPQPNLYLRGFPKYTGNGHNTDVEDGGEDEETNEGKTQEDEGESQEIGGEFMVRVRSKPDHTPLRPSKLRHSFNVSDMLA